MIIVKSPLRISIAGGGTDLPDFYKNNGCMFISAAIDKYIYITLHHSQFNSNIRLRYSQLEEVGPYQYNQIKNGIMRETLRRYNLGSNVEITSHAEIPDGTGLGSSGSFGVGLIQAILKRDCQFYASEASTIQMDIINLPIGFQDQYVAAYGGFNAYDFNKEGGAEITFYKNDLDKKLLLFFTGFKRKTEEVLKQGSTDGLEKIQEIAFDIKKAIKKKQYNKIGVLMNDHWQEKKKRGKIMTNEQIDEWYELGLKNGALGGKLVGAGGGGFLLFYTNQPERLIEAMPLNHLPFKFEPNGSRIIYEKN